MKRAMKICIAAALVSLVACAVPASTTLQGTYWKLLSLRGAPVEAINGPQEPHLVFDADANRMSGSGGCNRLGASITLDGDRLRFGSTQATRMSCERGMATEQSLLNELPAVARWRIRGERLQLLDEQGRELALFEARAVQR